MAIFITFPKGHGVMRDAKKNRFILEEQFRTIILVIQFWPKAALSHCTLVEDPLIDYFHQIERSIKSPFLVPN